MIMFLVKKGDPRIRKVEVLSATPRWVTLPGNFGGRRERIVSFYHRYHKTFEMAKHWLKTGFEVELKKIEAAYASARKQFDKIDALTEADL